MIEKYIIELLEHDGRVAIPELGTFFTKQQAASIDTDEYIVLPPVETVTFTDTVIESQKDDLRNLIFEKGEMFASQIEVEIEKYVEEIRYQIHENGSYSIPELGTLSSGMDGIDFDANTTFAVSSENFGLPKIEARPIEPIAENNTDEADERNESVASSEQTANAAIPWLIVAPLALLAIAVAYFFFNPEMYEKVKSMFPNSKPATEIVAPPSAETNEETANPTEENSTAEGEGKPDVKTDDGKAEETTKQPTTTTKPTVTSNGNGVDIVTQATNRYYLIAGSFKTVESAKKALSEAKGKGYNGAKIVKSDNRYRLSIGDYPDKAAATKAGVEAGNKDYKGAWPFKF